jgi:hypothetical protein
MLGLTRTVPELGDRNRRAKPYHRGHRQVATSRFGSKPPV